MSLDPLLFVMLGLFFLKKRTYYNKVLLPLVRWYTAYPLNINNLTELAADRGIDLRISETTITCIRRSYYPIPLFFNKYFLNKYAQWLAPPIRGKWKLEESHTRINRKQMYLYTLIDTQGKIIDFLALESQNPSEAMDFFHNSVSEEGIPFKIIHYLAANSYRAG